MSFSSNWQPTSLGRGHTNGAATSQMWRPPLSRISGIQIPSIMIQRSGAIMWSGQSHLASMTLPPFFGWVLMRLIPMTLWVTFNYSRFLPNIVQRYSSSKNCPNVCPLLRDQYGMKCWHKQGTWGDYVSYYDIMAWKWAMGHVIWIKTHWVIGQTKWLLIGAVFWPSIILLFSTLYDHLLP